MDVIRAASSTMRIKRLNADFGGMPPFSVRMKTEIAFHSREGRFSTLIQFMNTQSTAMMKHRNCPKGNWRSSLRAQLVGQSFIGAQDGMGIQAFRNELM